MSMCTSFPGLSCHMFFRPRRVWDDLLLFLVVSMDISKDWACFLDFTRTPFLFAHLLNHFPLGSLILLAEGPMLWQNLFAFPILLIATAELAASQRWLRITGGSGIQLQPNDEAPCTLTHTHPSTPQNSKNQNLEVFTLFPCSF